MGLLAHQGGWDEILLVLAPITVIALLVRIVQRRAEHTQRVGAEAGQSSERSIDAPNDPNFPTRSS